MVSNAPTNELVCIKAPVKTSTEFTSSTHYLAVVQVPLCTVPQSHGAKLKPEEDKCNKGSKKIQKKYDYKQKLLKEILLQSRESFSRALL